VRAAHSRYLPNCEKLWPHATEGASEDEIEFALARGRTPRRASCASSCGAHRVELDAGKGKVFAVTCIVAR